MISQFPKQKKQNKISGSMSIHIYKTDVTKNTSCTCKQILDRIESNTKKMANLRGNDLFATWEYWNLWAELHIKKVSQKVEKKREI